MQKRGTRTWAIFLIILTTGLTSSALLLFKRASTSFAFNWDGLFLNYFLLLGFICYAFAAVMMVIAFRGGEVNVLYPILATGYIWVLLLSAYIYHEPLSIQKMIAIALIVIGIASIAQGRTRSSAAEVV